MTVKLYAPPGDFYSSIVNLDDVVGKSGLREIVFFNDYFKRFHRAEIEAICLRTAAAPFGFAGFHQLAKPSPTLPRL